MHTIEVNNLSKIIRGTEVLHNINLSLNGGKVYGFIGKNGSGKTMLFRALSGIIKPSSGEIYFDKIMVKDHTDIFRRIGLVIENASLYPDFTGFKNLVLLSKINNLIDEDEVREAIVRVGLKPEDKRKIRKYSLGMKQRIAIAQAIMEKPDFLFLDEPTNALDTEGVNLIRKIIKEEADRGAIVLLASHNKEDIEQLCDDRFYMEEGYLSKEAKL